MGRRFVAASIVAVVGSLSLAGGVVPASAIVNGDMAAEPLTVSLQSVTGGVAEHECGGVLIAPQWVLTAAHCEDYIIEGQARLGSPYWNQGGETIPVADVFVDPAHDSSQGFGHDMGLVKLAAPATSQVFSMGMYGPRGSIGSTQGWGLTCDDNLGNSADPCWNSRPERLRQLAVKVEKEEFCNLKNSNNVQLNDPETMMCVVPADGSRSGTCFGDSGSPLFQPVQRKPVVVGIMIAIMNSTVFVPDVCSVGPNGAINRDAATKVAVELPWILSTLRANDRSAEAYVREHLMYIA